MSASLHRPAGTTSRGRWDVEITPDDAGWGWSSLRVVTLGAGERHGFASGDEELVVVPLQGSCDVDVDGERFGLDGREHVFTGPTDVVYVPRDADVVLSSAGGGRFALAGSRCERRLPARRRAAQDVPVELRGAGSCSRQVHGFAAADSFECDRLIAVEVVTPAGNWSSYPPHKHDEDRPGEESELEEIYYFEVADGPGGASGGSAGGGVGYHRVHGTPDRPLDLVAEVRSGDVVLVPHGWHGPSMAAPGYDLYYLNVMAGPSSERAWLIVDEPAHAWVRDTWRTQDVDPRLPLRRNASEEG